MIGIKNSTSETSLTCTSIGFPTPNITWFQSGVRVSTSPLLVISNAVYDEVIASTYCEAENFVGKQSSKRISTKSCMYLKPVLLYVHVLNVLEQKAYQLKGVKAI